MDPHLYERKKEMPKSRTDVLDCVNTPMNAAQMEASARRKQEFHAKHGYLPDTSYAPDSEAGVVRADSTNESYVTRKTFTDIPTQFGRRGK